MYCCPSTARFLEELGGKAVVLATGGFSADRTNDSSLLEEFAKDKLSLPTTNGAFATGDGVKMARYALPDVDSS